MKTIKNNKKIIILGISLLILAGVIIIALKGLNVSLMFGKHESIEIKLDREIDFEKVNEICNEVFPNKNVVVKGLEVFGESVQINIESITDEEKNNLVQKINEKFETTITMDDLKVYSVPNKRIRDVIKLYVKPITISFSIVFIYMLIRFRKIEPLKIIIDFITKVILTETLLLSVTAITRLPVSELIINLFMVVAIIELICYISKYEKKLFDLNDEEQVS